MDEDLWRNLAASDSAHGYLIEFLLRMLFANMSSEQIKELSGVLKSNLDDTSALKNVALGDDQRAERLADLTVKMRDEVNKLVDRAANAAADRAKKQGR